MVEKREIEKTENCALCEKKDKRTIIHHIYYEPPIELELCRTCHAKIHAVGRLRGFSDRNQRILAYQAWQIPPSFIKITCVCFSKPHRVRTSVPKAVIEHLKLKETDRLQWIGLNDFVVVKKVIEESEE